MIKQLGVPVNHGWRFSAGTGAEIPVTKGRVEVPYLIMGMMKGF